MILQKIYSQLTLWKAERKRKRSLKCHISKLWKAERQHKRLLKCYITELDKDPKYIFNTGRNFSLTPETVKDIPSLLNEGLNSCNEQNDSPI